jgi:hypothetical protein
MADIIDITHSGNLKDILDATRKYLDNMNDGDTILLPDLIDHITQETNSHRPTVATVVPTIARAHPGVVVKAGRNGGVIKGTPPPPRVDMRPRCKECNQVIRAKKEAIDLQDTTDTE